MWMWRSWGTQIILECKSDVLILLLGQFQVYNWNFRQEFWTSKWIPLASLDEVLLRNYSGLSVWITTNKGLEHNFISSSEQKLPWLHSGLLFNLSDRIVASSDTLVNLMYCVHNSNLFLCTHIFLREHKICLSFLTWENKISQEILI
jgi:hypothetical protein